VFVRQVQCESVRDARNERGFPFHMQVYVCVNFMNATVRWQSGNTTFWIKILTLLKETLLHEKNCKPLKTLQRRRKTWSIVCIFLFCMWSYVNEPFTHGLFLSGMCTRTHHECHSRCVCVDESDSVPVRFPFLCLWVTLSEIQVSSHCTILQHIATDWITLQHRSPRGGCSQTRKCEKENCFGRHPRTMTCVGITCMGSI